MASFEKLIFAGAAAVLLSACGGGSETPVSFDSNGSAPIGLTQYDIQTQAAKLAFDRRLAQAQNEADDWLNTNQRDPDVVTTASGLQYKINRASPNPDGIGYEPDQAITVHYEGRLIDGRVFNSSFERGRPDTLLPSDLIDGWQEALTLMKPGDEWTLFIPPGLGYGAIGKTGSVPPNAVIIFDVELR